MVLRLHLMLAIVAVSCFTINADQCVFDGVNYTKEGNYQINFHTKYLCMRSFVYLDGIKHDIVLIGSQVHINCEDSYLRFQDENGKMYNYCQNGLNTHGFFFFSPSSKWIEIQKKGDVVLNLTVKILKKPEITTIIPELNTTNPPLDTTIPPTYNPYTSDFSTVILSTPPTSTLAPVDGFCGKQAIKPYEDSYRIVGGFTAIKNSWPWQAAIYDGRNFCGATLINDQWLITAAHCDMYLATLRVKLGEHDINKPGDSIAVIKAEKFIKNPNFNNPYNEFEPDYDIALIKLSMPIVFTNSVSPICMPNGRRPYVGDKAIITGWGKLDYNDTQLSEYLQQTSVTILNKSSCGQIVTDRQICAGEMIPNVHSSCKGDSGGPLVIKDNSTDQFYLAGVVSGGRGQCNGRTYYTNVEIMEEWIKEMIEEN